VNLIITSTSADSLLPSRTTPIPNQYEPLLTPAALPTSGMNQVFLQTFALIVSVVGIFLKSVKNSELPLKTPFPDSKNDDAYDIRCPFMALIRIGIVWHPDALSFTLDGYTTVATLPNLRVLSAACAGNPLASTIDKARRTELFSAFEPPVTH
jgi:hypothetical protein